MSEKEERRFSWDSLSIIILFFYIIFQAVRWPLFPQHIDIYYHLLTSWGFVSAGGYVNWDFWQFAPIGRPHIYPPLFHMIMAILMKAGIDKILLAKIFSLVAPPLFLIVLWRFIKKFFSSRLAALSLLTISSSFSFYMSLTNHLPSTIAMIFGILAIEQFMEGRFLRSAIFLIICFYTHIGTTWFLLLTILIFSLMNKETRKSGIILSISAIAAASPILINQILNIKKIVIDPAFEKYFCEYKTIDYILAIIGFMLTMRMPKKYLLFAAFFIASFIYLGYPSRFFSSEGYISIALLAAVSLNFMFEKSSKQKLFKAAAILLIIFILIFSPTYAAQEGAAGIPEYRFFIFDSAMIDMLFPKTDERIISKTLWFKNYYDDAAQIIRKNSLKDDIVYCTTEVVGVCLASLSERATANHLLPEVYPSEKRDPFKDSAIIVTLKYNDPVWVRHMASKYDLVLVGSNEMFDIYKNHNNCAKMKAKKALIPFGVFFLLLIGLLFPLCFKIKAKSKLY